MKEQGSRAKTLVLSPFLITETPGGQMSSTPQQRQRQTQLHGDSRFMLNLLMTKHGSLIRKHERGQAPPVSVIGSQAEITGDAPQGPRPAGSRYTASDALHSPIQLFLLGPI